MNIRVVKDLSNSSKYDVINHTINKLEQLDVHYINADTDSHLEVYLDDKSIEVTLSVTHIFYDLTIDIIGEDRSKTYEIVKLLKSMFGRDKLVIRFIE